MSKNLSRLITTVLAASIIMLMAMIVLVATSDAKGSSSSGRSSSSSSSRSSGSGSSSGGSRPSNSSRPSSSNNSRPSGSNNRPAPRKVVVVRPKNSPRPGTRIRPRGQYRRQIIGGRPFLRQGNRLYTQRCCFRGRPYLAYYGNVAQKHKKSHTWIWIVLGGVVILALMVGLLYFMSTNRRRV